MSTLPGMALANAIPTASAFPHTIDRVERSAATGKDASGGPVEGWTTVYTGLVCLVAPGTPENVLEWEQHGMNCTHKAYFVRQADGTLPAFSVRDRVIWKGRAFQVQGSKDEAEMGLLASVDLLEVRKPPV